MRSIKEMWPFNRNKDQASIPQEIKEYYDTERRERTGIAWLLALGTLIVTIVLAMGLFFGGRWAYRTIVDRGDNDVQETGQNGESNPETAQAPNETPKTDSPSSGSDTNNAGTSQGSGGQPAPASNNQTPQTSSTSTSVPNTGPGLPNTGPGEVVTLFLITTAAGSIAHRYAVNRKYE